ncbi:hypothetical protein JMA_42570 (plasmid) [Jeotgalibacillus malaysiensis]|uniref:Uncharacterized protein n=1 Tax=Jeotgalibacillus malaysiensis TaxID=1508404 RepID=A0A0B5B055_9BACL|nr:hypothetical protein [Jeotgalibacillus malaysiensis]AJD93574.1 hypothetical protein JMA_42570 [Jeotgalibacillus malaysiensis]
MNQTKERWNEIRKKVESAHDYMDVNHWMHLLTAMDENEPNDGDYKKAFRNLRNTVLEDYVHVQAGKDPALDPFEETYHLLVYFETEKDGKESFKNYLLTVKDTLKSSQ